MYLHVSSPFDAENFAVGMDAQPATVLADTSSARTVPERPRRRAFFSTKLLTFSPIRVAEFIAPLPSSSVRVAYPANISSESWVYLGFKSLHWGSPTMKRAMVIDNWGNRMKKLFARGNRNLALISLVLLCAAGCSSPTTTKQSIAVSTPAVAAVTTDLKLAARADKFVLTIIGGFDADARQYISPSAKFNSKQAVAAISDCVLSSRSESFANGGPLSSELTCSDGDLVAIDITFDSAGYVVRMHGVGAKRKFDLSTS